MHFDVVLPTGRIASGHIQDGQFVQIILLAENRVNDFNLGDLGLVAQDGIEKVQCDARMLRISQQQLERVINSRIDSDGHELTTR